MRIAQLRFVRSFAMAAVVFSMAAVAEAAPVVSSPVSDPCTDQSDPVPITAVGDAEALFVGTWIRCEGAPSPFWAHEGEDVGLEFMADQTFHRIYEADDGGLIRADGLVQQGWWVAQGVTTGDQDPGLWIVDLAMKLVGSGVFLNGVTFYDDGNAMQLQDTMTATDTRYVRWPGASPAPGIPADIGTGPCGLPTEPIIVESSEQVRQLLIGTWTVCAGEPFGSGVLGVEFAADGTFRALVHSADGEVVVDERSVGATWWVWPFSEPHDVHNGPQVDVTYADGSTFILQPAFLADPPFVAAWPAAGMVAGTPSDSTVPPPTTEPADLPPTGNGSSWVIAALAGVLLAAGLALAGSAGCRRRAVKPVVR